MDQFSSSSFLNGKFVNNYDSVRFEILDPWSPSAIKLFKEFKKKLVDVTGDQEAGSFLGQGINLELREGTQPPFLGLHLRG